MILQGCCASKEELDAASINIISSCPSACSSRLATPVSVPAGDRRGPGKVTQAAPMVLSLDDLGSCSDDVLQLELQNLSVEQLQELNALLDTETVVA